MLARRVFASLAVIVSTGGPRLAAAEEPVSALSDVRVIVNAAERVAGFAHFWNGTGMSGTGRAMPFYDTPVVRANVELIGAVPFDGCVWNRPHNLLRYIWVRGLDTETPQFDFRDFDAAIDPMISAGQKLWFECMGVPRGADALLTDFRDEAQQAMWKKVVTAAVKHLIGRHGIETVRSWYFEAWNEADNPVSKRPHTWKPGEALAHFKASAAALTELDPTLRIGGPGSGSGLANDLYKDFERLGLPGTDGFQLDYLSYHHKATPRLQRYVADLARKRASANHPRGRSILIVNNEADADWEWDKAQPHRGLPSYAAYIARQVVEFQLALRAGEGGAGGGPSYLVFNDNAFLGDWGHRTQFTWFGDSHRFALVKKPAHNVMTLLALQGDEQVAVTGADVDSPVGVIASRRGADEVTVLLCRFDDLLVTKPKDTPPPEDPITVRLEVGGLPFKAGTITHYRIDNRTGNTEAQWRELGMPFEPTEEQLAKLRGGQELEAFGGRETVSGSSVSLTVNLPLPAVHLVAIRAARSEAPPAPQIVAARVYPGLHRDREDVLVRWRANVRGVATYRVEKALGEGGPWTVLKTPELLAGSHIESVLKGERAWYRVVAVDDVGVASVPSRAVRAAD